MTVRPPNVLLTARHVRGVVVKVWVRLFGCWSLVIICLACIGGSASGTEVHRFRSAFGGFNGPLGVAVNDATHDVFVVDSKNDRVEEFDPTGSTLLCEFNGATSPTGTFLLPTEVAIDNSGSSSDPSDGDVYVVDSGHGVIDKFDAGCQYVSQVTGEEAANGTHFEPGLGSNHSVVGVAVNNQGNLWVTLRKGALYEYSDATINAYVSQLETVFGGASEGLSADSEEDLYFNRGGGIFVKVAGTDGVSLANPFCGDEDAFRVAVDRSSREVYLDSRESIEACTVGGVPIESFGSGYLGASEGIAVDGSGAQGFAGTVFASDSALDNVSIFEAIVLPTVSLSGLSGQGTRGVTLNGTVDPEGSPVTSCVFEYATSLEYDASKTYSHRVACAPSGLGSGISPVAVSARLEGLEPGTTYDYRLVGENVAHVPSPTHNAAFFTGPIVGAEFATDVSSESASVHAPVDPNGAPTDYYVEYGLDGSYGLFAPLGAPGVELAGAAGEQNVTVHLQGLEAGSEYHYRFVTVQDGEAFYSPDRVFDTEPASTSGGLPDGRAWELVSPPNKKGALIEPFQQGGQVQAAVDGSAIAYVTEGPHVGEDPLGHVTYSQTLSKREAGKWSSQDLTLPGHLLKNGESLQEISQFQFEYRLFTGNLSLALVEPQIGGGTPLLSSEATERTLYLRDQNDDSFSALATPADVSPGPVEGAGSDHSELGMHFLAATPDLRHVVFKDPSALTPEATGETTDKSAPLQWNLYEWNEGKIALINVLPGDEGVAHGPYPGVPPVRLAGMTNANGLGRGGGQRELSDDGRFVAWAWGEPYTAEGAKNYRGLFVRDMLEEVTEKVGGPDALYQTMSGDGSKVFYLENGDLYVFNFGSDALTDITATHGVGETDAGVQESVSNVSEDGSYAYFVATGVLASGAVTGEDNLYLARDSGGKWSISFIATLSSEDNPTWYGTALFGAPDLERVSSRVSPDGRFLAFMSDRSLTGYDNIDAASGVRDEEVYLYDAGSGRLVCVSCDPTGARPSGVFDTEQAELLVDRQGIWTKEQSSQKDVRSDHWLAGSVPGWDNLNGNSASYQPRFLSNSGRLFFDSPVGLVPQDTNGLEDVYEFEPDGVGGCSTSVASSAFVFVKTIVDRPVDGCVGLVSSGTSSRESAFYDASENGDDVFFDTTAKLTGADYDTGYDLYDAHVCSVTAPCVGEVSVPEPCSSGDSCRAAPMPQPEIFGAPPSATFDGAGNIVEGPVRSVVRRSLTVKQKLVRALRECRKERGVRRKRCELVARRRYKPRHAKRSAHGSRFSARRGRS